MIVIPSWRAWVGEPISTRDPRSRVGQPSSQEGASGAGGSRPGSGGGARMAEGGDAVTRTQVATATARAPARRSGEAGGQGTPHPVGDPRFTAPVEAKAAGSE